MSLKHWVLKKLGFDPGVQKALQDCQRELELLKVSASLKDERIIELELELKNDPVRNLLGSINLTQTQDPLVAMESEERMQYVQQVFGAHQILKKEIEWLLNEQVQWWARNSLGNMFSDEKTQNAFARGNINFADLMLERFTIIVQEHLDNVEERKEKQANKDEPKSPLSSEASFEVLNLVNKIPH